ncbi:E3 ubiquitin-protein ligase ARIH1-like [Sycon ciliatum]|uniref:E3 ubiquitin-protein ligase ARIH1-like n=1 Tax=Sycon ciliatum TaxID=27933 RepID=UPI0020AE3B10|eukprot:scpid44994/ scgid7399/ E3 ubiquitin-protein ligase ARIH1; H7-AP2; HHARI; Monocyte protein 6; Protein ariadne-1 homolog; UbcH7-binding protein; UbcM4-interacting protein; Ubiquitin-conjugating enzyme E2-binding protein 1
MDYGLEDSEPEDIELDDDDDDDDEGVYGDNALCGEETVDSAGVLQNFTVLSKDDIAQNMVDSIKEVNEIFEVDPLTARALLVHFKWDKEMLLERYYEGDPSKLMSDAHIVIAPKVTRPCSSCDICLLDVPPSEMSCLPCGHTFCNSCWRQYLTTMIMELGVGQRISCAGHGCEVLMDEFTVSNLLVSSAVKQKYNFLMSKNFVEANRLMQWCPAPGCTYAIRCSERDARRVRCKCGRVFCFRCTQPAHEPVRCDYLAKWLKKCADDSETSHWIHANTKECPKCKATIEKNGGCNHMVCRNQACKAEFCWVCLGAWQPHGASWYNCNRYAEKDAEAARGSQEESRKALERYLFFCDRYLNHLRSENLEKKLYTAVKQKMDEVQNSGLPWIDSQFLVQAVDVLSRCRAVLKYSYVFAYYLEKNNQAQIFLDNQKDFEMATEALSGFLERDITGTNLAMIKSSVQDKSQYCRLRCTKLLDHVNEGYEKDWWAYVNPDSRQ